MSILFQAEYYLKENILRMQRWVMDSKESCYFIYTDVLYIRQGKADDQLNWRVLQNEKLVRLREKLRCNKEQLVQGWFSIAK